MACMTRATLKATSGGTPHRLRQPHWRHDRCPEHQGKRAASPRRLKYDYKNPTVIGTMEVERSYNEEVIEPNVPQSMIDVATIDPRCSRHSKLQPLAERLQELCQLSTQRAGSLAPRLVPRTAPGQSSNGGTGVPLIRPCRGPACSGFPANARTHPPSAAEDAVKSRTANMRRMVKPIQQTLDDHRAKEALASMVLKTA